MEFFQKISNSLLRNGDTLQLVISKKDDSLSVTLMPGTSASSNDCAHMIPLVLSGAPNQLDSGFFDYISEPITQAIGIQANIKQFEEALKQSRAKSSMGQKEKSEIDKLLKEADTQEQAKKFSSAIIALNKAKAIQGADKDAIDKRIKILQEKAGAGTLFGSDISQSEDVLSFELKEVEE